jgi:hypothetical protein
LATGNVPVAPELQEQLAELDREQRELVRRLLGVDLRTELARYLGQVDYVAQRYDFLPEEKRQSAELVTLEHDELEDEIYRRSKGLLLSEDRAELRRLREERRVAFEAILTPEELQEYDLRYSDTAKNMRADLAGFEPTEEEFREIFRLRSAYDSSFAAVLDSDDDAALEAQAAGFFALSSELVEVLGKERAAEYQRVQDSDYLTLLQLGERFEASPDIARSVYNMKLAAEQFKVQIESNPNLTVEQRLRTAAALARETERSVAATMGEEIFDEYRETGGRWLANLPAIDENAAPPPPQQTGTVLPYDINLLPPDLRNYLLNPPVFGPPPLPPR